MECMSNNYYLTRPELLDLLCEQLRFLSNSSDSFDRGEEEEAKRLATTVRVLLHDTRANHSLLHQLKLKHLLQMLDTADEDDPQNPMPFNGLVGFMTQSVEGKSAAVEFNLLGPPQEYTASDEGEAERVTMRYIPRVNLPLDSAMANLSHVSFQRWWNAPVIRDASRTVFTRQDVVLGLSNKDGGAHVDPKMDLAYARISRFNSMGFRVVTGDSEAVRPPNNSVIAASVRQVAYEVIESVHRALPDLCPESRLRTPS
jgi:hypothetical protein